MSSTALEIPGYVAGTWDIDPAHTEAGFSVRHLVVTKVRGRFADVKGTITTAENPLESSVDIEIGLDSITTNQEQRDNHLRSADFFEVETYPTMTYKASGARQDGDKYVLDGELTLKGVTKVVPLTFELNGIGENPLAGGTVAGFSATASINRKDFNVNFGAVQNGVAIVSDRVDIHLEVEANLRKPEA
ncbi:YceI family protein [Actinophytocola oryzae]|uniref:Polyisoprenoid-binding protein YceI n=1 Tax=Actinophytocola oryzae TaxID=502181 RepID=A0A4R7VI82_9PSEU|nr:YceI family protein [Actinophytocola oryzae]TDV48887.1 polyisoprenoid-binding protein YceI [Actinophytocola oryzae]